MIMLSILFCKQPGSHHYKIIFLPSGSQPAVLILKCSKHLNAHRIFSNCSSRDFGNGWSANRTGDLV